MEAMFRVFDMDQDGVVGPEEFVLSMSVFLHGSLDEKIDCMYYSCVCVCVYVCMCVCVCVCAQTHTVVVNIIVTHFYTCTHILSLSLSLSLSRYIYIFFSFLIFRSSSLSPPPTTTSTRPPIISPLQTASVCTIIMVTVWCRGMKCFTTSSLQ